MILITIQLDEANGFVRVTGGHPNDMRPTEFERSMLLELDTIVYSRAEDHFGVKPCFEDKMEQVYLSCVAKPQAKV